VGKYILRRSAPTARRLGVQAGDLAKLTQLRGEASREGY